MEIIRVGVILGGNFSGGNCLDGISWVRIFFGGSFPGGKRPEGIIPVAISGWEFSRYLLY